jgi:tRNA modification GTPase
MTIFAPASGSGKAAVAVVRISGPASGAVLRAFAGTLPAPRRASLRILRDPATGEKLDRALVFWFPAPASFTGEDAAELHLHGGRAVRAATLAALSRTADCRLAEPGEFTRRALRHGKMDLTGAEALADLIDAETEAQRRQALRLIDNALGTWVGGLRERLLEALALAEGAIDFVEEDDIAGALAADLLPIVDLVRHSIAAQLAYAERGAKLREGLVVTIAGPPNVGKSTLLNALAGREVAIVSAYAGTTRDPIEVELDLGGIALRLIDTAGLRPTDDPVEREGIRRAEARARSADLVLWLREIGSASPAPQGLGPMWTIATKTDRAPALPDAADHRISAQSGAGLPELLSALQDFAAEATVGAESALVTHLRQQRALEAALQALKAIVPGREVELTAEDLRFAIRALERIVGQIDVEEVLGAIFARFCIGK